LLLNRFYIGEVRYKGDVFAGEQPLILDRGLFDAVQARLEQQRTNHTAARHASDSVLMGLIFDDQDQRMTPIYAVKNGVRYRYYISSNLNHASRLGPEYLAPETNSEFRRSLAPETKTPMTAVAKQAFLHVL
jgi:hypothetical protein